MSIKAASGLNIAIGAAGFLLLGNRRLFAASALMLVLPFLPVGIASETLDSGVSVYGDSDTYKIRRKDRTHLFIKEGLTSTIAVTSNRSGSIGLRTNGKTDASTGDDMTTQLALGYFPVILHSGPRDVLVIGFGSGVTVRAVRDFPEIRGITCVEIEPAVFEAAGFFRNVNEDVLLDPKIKYYVDDARSHIVSSGRKYDIIISEPSNPWISGIGSLYSKEFYKTASARLKKGGIFCQWLQLYHLRTEDMKMALATFASVFPETSLWRTSGGDVLLIGSEEPPAFDNVLDGLPDRVRKDLMAYFNIRDQIDFFSYFVTDTEGVRAASAGAEINTDDRPLLEFNAPLALYSETVTANLNLLFVNARLPSLPGYSASSASEIYYRKSVNFRRLGFPVIGPWIDWALEDDPDNPDYLAQKAGELRKSDAESARTYAGMALSIDPDNPNANYEMAKLLEGSDRSAAEIHFDKAAASLMPSPAGGDDYERLVGAAQFSISSKNDAKALGYLLRAYKLPHAIIKDGPLLYNIGTGFMRLNRFDEAVYYLDKSLMANPYDPESMLSLADSYLMLKMNDKACGLYKNALRFSEDGIKTAIDKRVHKYCGGS